MLSFRKVVLPLLTLLGAVLAPTPGRADILAFTLGDQFIFPSATPVTDGFLFTPTAPLRVTRLGYFDEFQDGLLLDHPVALFDAATQTVIAQATVGPSSPLDGLFAFADIPPIILQPGVAYVLAGFHPGSTDDAVALSVVGGLLDAQVVPDPRLGYRGYLFDNTNNALTFPTGTPDTTFFAFGPNFTFQQAEVPEPTTLALLTLALVGAAGRRRRGR